MISSYVRILNYKEADYKGISLLIKLKFVKNPNSVLITFIIFVYYMETIDCFFLHDAAFFAKIRNFLYGCKSKIYFVCHILK